MVIDLDDLEGAGRRLAELALFYTKMEAQFLTMEPSFIDATLLHPEDMEMTPEEYGQMCQAVALVTLSDRMCGWTLTDDPWPHFTPVAQKVNPWHTWNEALRRTVENQLVVIRALLREDALALGLIDQNRGLIGLSGMMFDEFETALSRLKEQVSNAQKAREIDDSLTHVLMIEPSEQADWLESLYRLEQEPKERNK